MQRARSLGMRRLMVCFAITAAVLAGLLSASAEEAASSRDRDRDVSTRNPCSVYFKKFPDSRTRALLECQKQATSKVPPHLTGDEASKIYDAYLARMSKGQNNNVADKRD